MVQTAVTQVVKTLNEVHERFGLRRSLRTKSPHFL
jgi:hypothetical protein